VKFDPKAGTARVTVRANDGQDDNAPLKVVARRRYVWSGTTFVERTRSKRAPRRSK
jgi:hypothetical protein